MKKLRIGIVGYGNLGKATEELALKNESVTLKCIFTRRNLKDIKSPHLTKICDVCELALYKDKIDVLIMCGGSQKDLPLQSPKALKNFNIIDSFDTHKKIASHRKNLQKVASISGRTAIMSCGWDPGLLSMLRGIFSVFFEEQFTNVFWGEGVSQGHSEALRNIKGVKDALQFTIPNENQIKILKQDVFNKIEITKKHRRVCYIEKNEKACEEEITQAVLKTPNYFLGQQVEINFVSKKELSILKKQMNHAGLIFAGSKITESHAEFNLKISSNPIFTANILLAYAQIIPKLNKGKVYNILEIPIGIFDDKMLRLL